MLKLSTFIIDPIWCYPWRYRHNWLTVNEGNLWLLPPNIGTSADIETSSIDCSFQVYVTATVFSIPEELVGIRWRWRYARVAYIPNSATYFSSFLQTVYSVWSWECLTSFPGAVGPAVLEPCYPYIHGFRWTKELWNKSRVHSTQGYWTNQVVTTTFPRWMAFPEFGQANNQICKARRKTKTFLMTAFGTRRVFLLTYLRFIFCGVGFFSGCFISKILRLLFKKRVP